MATSDPVIQPPTPVIRQTDTPEEVAHTLANVQKIFDKVAPHMGDAPKPEPPKVEVPTVQQPTESATEPVKTEEPSTAPESPEPAVTVEPSKIPSFIEKALAVEESQPESPKPVDDLPEELPTFKTPEESKNNWRQFRDKYKQLKTELDAIKSQPRGTDEKTTQELEYLRNQTKELSQTLSRLGVERHSEFQQKIIAPMTAAWNDAAGIVQAAGGNPQDLAKAMALSGRAHFEAMDEIFSGLPETAKLEATEAIRAYRKLDNQRRAALADAPKTAQALQKADLERQYAQVESQREEMKRLWEDAGRKLRDEAKVEVLQKSTDPDAKWWNEQADQLEETSRKLFLENTDMGKVAIAMRLAPMVDVYRKLWLATRQELGKKESIIKEKFGSEPNLSESGGNIRGNGASLDEDLKKPFADVFLKKFHELRATGR